MPDSEKTFKYIDLFSGCGGLSLGLETEGGELLLAVERSPMAGETFYHNLIQPLASRLEWENYLHKSAGEQIALGLLVSELATLVESKTALKSLASEQPDVVVGGPPCQGFSLAGRRKADDKRNQLPWQFLDVVERTDPKMVVIENVVGMRHKFSANQKDAVFDQLQQALRKTGKGYVVQAVEVNALHYGAPQHRPRLMIIGLRRDLAAKKKITSTGTLWKSEFLDHLKNIPPLAPVPTVSSAEARSVADAISNLAGNEAGKRFVQHSDYAELMDDADYWAVLNKPENTKNHIQRNHQPHAIERFRLYQIFAANRVDSRIFSRMASLSDEDAKIYLGQAFANIKFPLSSPDGELKLKSKKDLVSLTLRLKTKKHSQRILPWVDPARTVVTIGDDYVHPSQPRTFTVRELARFQGFPDSFEFRGKETTGGLNRQNEVPQYSQVGNAVSPMLALAVGKLIKKIL